MTDVAALLLRLWLGTVMVAHGRNHLRSRTGTARWFGSVGFRWPRIQAALSGAGEVAIGTSLILGLLTNLGTAGLIAIMTVAFWSIHRFAGFFVFARPDEGYEYVVTLVAAATAVSILGPGRVSLDVVVFGGGLDGWAGAATAAAGLLLGALQLLVSWRRPPDSGD